MALLTRRNPGSAKEPYTTLVADDGKLECNCRGWATYKKVKPRSCKHVLSILDELGNPLTITKGGSDGKEFLYLKNYATALGNIEHATTTKNNTPTAKQRAMVTNPKIHEGFAIIDYGDAEEAPVDTGYVNPMLAQAIGEKSAFERWLSITNVSQWVAEEKYNGHRKVVAVTKSGVVTTWSRPGRDKAAIVKPLPAHINAVMTHLSEGTYDGELMLPGGSHEDVNALEHQNDLVFVMFDIMRLFGQDVTKLSYAERRSLLEAAYYSNPDVRDSKVVLLAGTAPPSVAFLEEIWSRGGEGIMVKRVSARYQPGRRSPDILKVKEEKVQTMTILGFTAAKLGPYATMNLQGKDGSTVSIRTLTNALLARIEKDPQSFIGRDIEIKYTARTPDGSYWNPRLYRFTDE